MNQIGINFLTRKTSREANARTNKLTDIKKIKDYLRECGSRGANYWEAAQALKMTPNTCSARFTYLRHEDDEIEQLEETRPTGTGSPATVLRIRGV